MSIPTLDGKMLDMAANALPGKRRATRSLSASAWAMARRRVRGLSGGSGQSAGRFQMLGVTYSMTHDGSMGRKVYLPNLP